MKLKNKNTEPLGYILDGIRKKLLITILSLITGLILIVPFIKPVSILYNINSIDPIGVESINFETYVPNKGYQHVVGNLFRIKSTMKNVLNPLNCTNGTASAVILLHDWNWGIGKESLIKYSIEISRRGFVVLAIDLPGNGHTTGFSTSIAPNADLEPYIISASINYLKRLCYVNSSSIGIVGFGYGASAAALSAGILKENLNATVLINGFYNFTDLLISNNGLLQRNVIEFEFDESIIHLKSIKGIQIKPDDMNTLLNIYSMFRGDSEFLKEMIIPGTTNLNRTILRKYDAVEYLSNATPNSLLFIHSIKNDIYSNNQSGQGFNSSTNGALYIPLDWDHEIQNCDNVTWIIINFLKEKLFGIELPNLGSALHTYSQQTDALGFSTNEFFTGMPSLLKSLIYLFGAAVPVSLIINVFYFSKKYEIKRTKRQQELQSLPKAEREVRFKGGNYRKVFTGVIFQIIFASILLWMVGNGFETGTSVITITTIYYITFYFTLIYIPDEAEIKLQKGIPLEKPLKNLEYYLKTPKKNKLYILLLTCTIISIVCLFFGLTIPVPTMLNKPLDSPASALLCAGIFLILTALLYIRKIIIENENKISWVDFDLDFYSLVKSGVCGISSGLNIFVAFNNVVFWIRYPFMLGARTEFFGFVVIASIIFAVGFHLWTEVILRKTIHFGFTRKKKIIAWIISTLIGTGLSIIAGYLITIKSFNVGFLLPFNLSFIFGLLCGFAYLIARLIELISSEKGILTSTIYTSIVFVAIAAIFVRI